MRVEPCSAAAMLAALSALSGQRPQPVDARVKRRQRASQGVHRRRRDDVDRIHQPADTHAQQRADRAHEMGPVDQRQALLALQLQRLQPERRQRLGAADQRPAGSERLALTEQRQERVRRWRQIAAGAQRAGARHPRHVAAVEQRRDPLDHQRAHARMARASARWRAPPSRRARPRAAGRRPVPAAWLRSRLTWRWRWSSGATVFETSAPKPVLIPYTGVPVDRISSSTCPVARDRLERDRIEFDPRAARDRRDVVGGQLAGQGDGSGQRRREDIQGIRSRL